jgi:hypothetical protein
VVYLLAEVVPEVLSTSVLELVTVDLLAARKGILITEPLLLAVAVSADKDRQACQAEDQANDQEVDAGSHVHVTLQGYLHMKWIRMTDATPIKT